MLGACQGIRDFVRPTFTPSVGPLDAAKGGPVHVPSHHPHVPGRNAGRRLWRPARRGDGADTSQLPCQHLHRHACMGLASCGEHATPGPMTLTLSSTNSNVTRQGLDISLGNFETRSDVRAGPEFTDWEWRGDDVDGGRWTGVIGGRRPQLHLLRRWPVGREHHRGAAQGRCPHLPQHPWRPRTGSAVE